MTTQFLVRMVIAASAAVALVSCGGAPTATGPAAQQQPLGDTQATDATQGTDATPGTDATQGTDAGGPTSPSGEPAPASGDGGARPGGPGPGAATAGGARPGGPFDVEAFENRGEDLAGFRSFGAEHCAGGRCVLVEQTSTDPGAQDGCEIADFAYDPPAQPPGAPPADQFIQRGTTVTVFVHCPPEAGEPGTTDPSDQSAASDTASDTAPDTASDTPSDTASESSPDGSGG